MSDLNYVSEIDIFDYIRTTAIQNLMLDPGFDPDMQREAAGLLYDALDPRDVVQAQAAARVITVHFAAMEFFRRAAQPGICESDKAELHAIATKMSRLSVQVLKYLKRRKVQAARAAQQIARVKQVLGAARPAPTPEPPEPTPVLFCQTVSPRPGPRDRRVIQLTADTAVAGNA